MASSPASNSGVQIVGVIPQDETMVTTDQKRIVEGKYLDDVGRYPLVIGKKLAEKLGVRVHSKVILSFAGRDGSIIYGSFRVVGIFETESTVFDRSTLFIRRSDLAGLLGGPPLVHEIAVRLERAESLPGILASTKAKYPTLAVDGWKDLAPELKLTSEMTDVSMLFFLAIILFGLLFGITNTMLMSVLDRVREFGVLMAIGMKRKRVFWLIIFETVFLSLTGGVMGVVVGAVAIDITYKTGINLSIVAEGLSSYGISSMLYPFIPPMMYLWLALLVILTALCAAIYPGLKATKLNPASSIRTYA
jgi:putative ABC transport system permease protein